MPAHPFQTNFTAGELTEKLDARVDFSKYANGANCLRNFVVQAHGGAARRAGTFFVAEAKDSTQKIALARFEFSIDQAYILEIGNQYIRFYTDRARLSSAGVPVEVASPYLIADVFELRFAQSADVLYIAHPDYAPQKLQRLSATSFQLVTANFDPPPSIEQPIEPAATLTLSATTGTAVTATASAPAFLDADVGRQLAAGAGVGVITGFTSTTVVTINVIDAFSSVGPHAAGDWEIRGSPNTTITPAGGGPVGSIHTFTLTINGWRTTDVGKFIVMNGGVAEIVTFLTTTQVNARIRTSLTNTTPAPGGAWTLESAAWSTALGFPGVVTFHQDRLWFFGNANQPDTAWGSKTGDYENFAAGASADDAVTFTVAESGVNLIRWARSSSILLVGTLAGEFAIDGGPNEAITPSNVQIKPQSFYGTDFTVDALRIGNAVMFMQRGATKLRETAFSFEADSYVATDISILSEHLFRDGITQMAYIGVPDQLIFAVRTDGVLLAAAYERPEQVVAWTHHTTDGFYESVATMTNFCGTADEVWVSVRRTVNGVTRRYIECFDGAMLTDSGLVYSGTPVTLFTGLSHLEAKVLEVLNGTADLSLTVASGEITLPQASGNIQAGLGFDSQLVTLRPEVPTRSGTSQSRHRHWNEVVVRWYCTEGTPEVTCGGPATREPFRLPAGESRPYTGDARIDATGWSHLGDDARITVEQRGPYRATVLGITGSFDVD